MTVLTPPRISPPERAPTGLRFMATFVRNPLQVIPQAAYVEDRVAVGNNRVWVTSPAIIKAVLLDERDKFRKLTQIRLLGPLLGKGILTSEGADWKWQRQASAPMFRPQTLGTFVPAFVRAANDTVARWRAAPGVHDIDADMTRATFDVVSATLLPSADDAFVTQMQASIRAMQRNGGWDMLYAAINLPKWFPRPGMVDGYDAARGLRAEVARLLAAQRDSGEDDLLHRLIAARDPETGRGMDDEQLVDNLLTFYLAGHETTAKALGWTLYLLARSPQWMQRVAHEVREVTGGEALTAAHVERLQLTQQVLKESMRPLSACADHEPAGGGGQPGWTAWTSSPGMSILMPIYAIHRHRASLGPARMCSTPRDSRPRARMRSRATTTCPFRAPARACASACRSR
jgi:cytochrome P450